MANSHYDTTQLTAELSWRYRCGLYPVYTIKQTSSN